MEMRRGAALVFLLTLTAACARPSPSAAPARRTQAEGPRRQVAILVQGTAGVRFEGSWGEPGATQTIKGQVPAHFTAQVRQNVYVRVQKAGREGKITVLVLVDGQEVASRATTKPFGLITVLYPPAR